MTKAGVLMGSRMYGPDAYRPGSMLWRFRAQRFERFTQFAAHLPRPLRIIDVGGTNAFWKAHGWAELPDVSITLINLTAERQLYSNILPVAGDATDLAGIPDKSFDLAFSNSTIEHLFTHENQVRMAAEISRVAAAYWVQTPNYWFPVEPHFQFPGWQWLPLSVRKRLIRRRRFGWRGPCATDQEAMLTVSEIRLLTRAELQKLFPDATMLSERVLGMNKSWIAVRHAQ